MPEGYTVVDASQYWKNNPGYAEGWESLPAITAMAMSGGIGYGSRINTPSPSAVDIDLEHIITNHTASGVGYQQSGIKTAFPEWMGDAQVETAIRTAYANASQVRSAMEGGVAKIWLQGTAGGLVVEMIYNKETKTIETAYPPSTTEKR